MNPQLRLRPLFSFARRLGLLSVLLLVPLSLQAQTTVASTTAFNLGVSGTAAASSTAQTMTSSAASAAGVPFTSYKRLAVTATGNNYDVQLRTTTTAAIAQGDLLVATFWVRNAGSSTAANFRAVFEQASSPYTASLSRSYEIDGRWRRLSLPFVSVAAYASGAAKFNLQLGQALQTLEVGDITVVNYGSRSLYSGTPSFWTNGSTYGTTGTYTISGYSPLNGKSAYQLTTTSIPSGGGHQFALASNPANNVNPGDTILVVFHMRRSSTTPDQARVTMKIQRQSSPYMTVVETPFYCSTAWTEVQMAYTVPTGKVSGTAFSTPDKLSLLFQVGYQLQAVDIAGIQLYNLGTLLAPSDLTGTLTYGGRELGASWRSAAATRIDTLRKADLSVVARNGSGGTLANTPIALKMIDHAFGFGTAVNPRLIATGTDADNYRANLQTYFNKAVIENSLKWDIWEDDHRSDAPDSERYEAQNLIQRLQNLGIWDIRNHVLVWPGTSGMPPDVAGLTGTALRDRVLLHISGQPTHATKPSVADHAEVKGYMRDTDVINELYSNRFVQDTLGDYGVEATWFTRAAAADVRPRLFVNDFNLEGRPYDQDHQDYTYGRLQAIQAAGAPIHGLGMQGHYDHRMPSMDEFKAALDRFGALGLLLQVTEFDHGINDRELQADFLRDYLTMAFSHEKMDAFLVWGFWDTEHWRKNSPIFDQNWKLKPSGHVWRSLVLGEWFSSSSGTTSSSGGYSARVFKGDHEITLTVNNVAYTYNTYLSLEPGETDPDRTVYPVYASGQPTLCGMDLRPRSPGAGSTSLNNGVWTLNSSGYFYNQEDTSTHNDIAYDEAHFASKLTSATTVSARVTSLPTTNHQSKSGVMIRNSLASDSAYFAVMLSPGDSSNPASARIQYRAQAGGATTTIGFTTTGITAPRYLRIVRSGSNSFTAAHSSDGTTWTTLGSVAIRMNSQAHAGIFTSSSSGTVGAATFTNVNVP